jgi:hypothetical protein
VEITRSVATLRAIRQLPGRWPGSTSRLRDQRQQRDRLGLLGVQF